MTAHLEFARMRRCGILLAIGLGIATSSGIAAGNMHVDALVDLSLEELGSVVVTSVSRRKEPLARAAASVYVVTRDDIRRSGATSLPEALRLAPNLDVARADANQYAISARGFNNVLANKMLVLIDGRTVYTPLFSGVFWEAQDVMLEDIDRIEVISGPGTTLWGVNAVNGVINVITKPARETQGTLLATGGGNREANAAARQGGTLASDVHYRLYAKYGDRRHSEMGTGVAVRDASERGQMGFRIDRQRPDGLATLQGDAYVGDIDQPPAARDIRGANVLARFERELGDGRSFGVLAYYDHTRRTHPETFRERLDTLAVEGQFAMRAAERHRLLLGGGYRYARDRVENSPTQAFLPAHRVLRWAHAFVQDDIALRDDLELTVGAKVESNVYSGSDVLPNVRLAWQLGRDRLIWGALSRATRAPSRIDRDFFVPGTEPHALLAGGPDFESEISKVAEVGYRSTAAGGFDYSITAFYHRLERLRSLEPVTGSFVFANNIEGRTRGVEGWGAYHVTPSWRVSGGGVLLRQRLRLTPGSNDPGAGLTQLGNDPRHWWSLRSQWTFARDVEVDIGVRRVGARPFPVVPAYTAVDIRLGWNALPNVQVSLSVTNVADPRHPEWGPAANRIEHERAMYLGVLWRL